MATIDSSNDFDVIILGTGLVESLAACAISKIGKKMLHLDTNDYYGNENASFSLKHFIEECLNNKSNVADSCCDLDNLLAGFNGNTGTTFEPNSVEQLINNSRKYNIDNLNNVVYCNGEAVNAMIKSGVDNYLEFNCIEGLFYYRTDDTDKLNQWKVPCSKSDIFSTTLLNNSSKRCLMKFLQFTADWGRIHVEGLDDITSLNERELATGRALHRPQNKNNTEVNQYDNDTLKAISFVQLMKEAPHSLPMDLIYMIYYALCLQSDSISVDNSIGNDYSINAFHGLQILYNHIQSLNRYGKTAFLYPLYGIGELAQAFCRMSAVWGGMYMLRTDVLGCELLPSDGTPSDLANISRTPSISINTDNGLFTCKHFICNNTYWNKIKSIPNSPNMNNDVNNSSKYLVKRTSIFASPLLVEMNSKYIVNNGQSGEGINNDNELHVEAQHVIGIIPPYSLHVNVHDINYHHDYAVHIVQLASKANIAPDNNVIVYYSTTVSCDVYDTYLHHHISMESKLDRHQFMKSLSSALMSNVVMMLSSVHTSIDTVTAKELFYVTRVQAMNTVSVANNLNDTNAVHISGIEGMSHQSLDVNHYFTEARALFHQLYPNEDFLVKPHDVGCGQVEAELAEEAVDMDLNATDVENNANENQTSTVNPPLPPPPPTVATFIAPPPIVDEDMEYLLETLRSIS